MVEKLKELRKTNDKLWKYGSQLYWIAHSYIDSFLILSANMVLPSG